MYLDRSWRWINDHSNVEQGNSTIGTSSCRFLTPPQVKAFGGAWLGWWHKIWCNCKCASIMLEKIRKIAMQKVDQAMKCTRKHTHKEISGVVQPRMRQNVESTEMLLLHNTRETLAWLHNRRIRRLVHNLLSKNATTSIPSMLYARCFYDMIQDDLVWQS